MYLLKVKASFAAAHFLREYKGKCENLHGHNWNVEATVSRSDLKSDGMVMDFGDLKRLLNDLLQELDHSCINEHPHFSTVNPTSENIAAYLYHGYRGLIQELDENIRVESIAVEESEGSLAIYIHEDQ